MIWVIDYERALLISAYSAHDFVALTGSANNKIRGKYSSLKIILQSLVIQSSSE